MRSEYTVTLLDALSQRIAGRKSALVMPEGTDARILAAARTLSDRDLARVILLGAEPDIERAAAEADVSLEGIRCVDPARSEHLDAFAAQYRERRSQTRDGVARRLVAKPLFFAGSMVSAGMADAMLAGASSTTARVIEASLLTIGLADGISTPSSCFLMLLPATRATGERALIYADCAVTVAPTTEQLADIALAAAETGRALLRGKPRIAFLSFSTRGSGKHALARKIAEAAALAATRAPHLAIDGELQADAALDARVARLKVDDPGDVAGRANVLVFPDLNSGNIAYKLTQYLAGASVVGPLLQGFAKPVADLSRGATVDEIVTTAVVTLAMATGG